MGSLAASSARTVAPPSATLRLLPDERLARLAAGGSEAAFAAIFERHHQALHRYCHSILGNGHDAADALQNTMVKALRALPGEQREIKLKPWLYRIAHNESISLLRARRPDGDLDGAAHVGDHTAEGIVESRERLRELTTDLQALTEQQRGALLMRELGGLEFAEVAGALAVSSAAAKQSVYEARCALQAMAEGRAMDCDLIRRSLSDGDKRTLRSMKMRGHLRSCAGCRDFEAALRHRPGQLAALAPPLPLAAAAAMLHSVLGGAGHGGGGLAAGLGASAAGAAAPGSSGLLTAGLGAGAKTGGAFSLGAAKVVAAVVVAGSVAGAGAYVAPRLETTHTAPAQVRDAARGGAAVSAPATAAQTAQAAQAAARRAASTSAQPATTGSRASAVKHHKPPASAKAGAAGGHRQASTGSAQAAAHGTPAAAAAHRAPATRRPARTTGSKPSTVHRRQAGTAAPSTAAKTPPAAAKAPPAPVSSSTPGSPVAPTAPVAPVVTTPRAPAAAAPAPPRPR